MGPRYGAEYREREGFVLKVTSFATTNDAGLLLSLFLPRSPESMDELENARVLKYYISHWPTRDK